MRRLLELKLSRSKCHWVVFSAGLLGMLVFGRLVAEEVKLTVSASHVARSGSQAGKLADFFVERLGIGRDFEARRVRNRYWLDRPEGASPASHVNLLQLRYGNRLELLATMVDPEKGTVDFAARAQALCEQRVPDQTYWRSPGDFQYTRNAPNDLVVNFANTWAARSRPKGTYQLILAPWDQDSADGEPGELLTGNAVVDEAQVRGEIYPLAAAAMYANNYLASSKPQESRIVLEVNLEVVACDLRATLFEGEEKVRQVTRYDCAYEQLYGSLRLLFLDLLEWDGAIVSLRNLGAKFEPLLTDCAPRSATNQEADPGLLLAGQDDEGYLAFDPISGKMVWQWLFDKWSRGVCRNGLLVFYFSSSQQVYPSFARISSANGTRTWREKLVEFEDLHRFDSAGDLAVYSNRHHLYLLDQGREVWRRELSRRAIAGPLLDKGTVVYGNLGGELVCVDQEGNEPWRTKLPERAVGEIYSAGGFYFADDEHGTMYVLDQRGKLLWQARLGDVMVNAPEVVGNMVLVGAKSRKLFLFSKRNGECLRTHGLKSWLLACRVVGGKVVCLLLGHRLRVLDLPAMELERELRFCFRWRPRIIPVEEFPLGRSRDELPTMEKLSGCLLADIKGNLFLFSVAPDP